MSAIKEAVTERFDSILYSDKNIKTLSVTNYNPENAESLKLDKEIKINISYVRESSSLVLSLTLDSRELIKSASKVYVDIFQPAISSGLIFSLAQTSSPIIEAMKTILEEKEIALLEEKGEHDIKDSISNIYLKIKMLV